jgi:hypothetical protein
MMMFEIAKMYLESFCTDAGRVNEPLLNENSWNGPVPNNTPRQPVSTPLKRTWIYSSGTIFRSVVKVVS